MYYLLILKSKNDKYYCKFKSYKLNYFYVEHFNTY